MSNEPKQRSGLGVGIGLTLWGIALLAIPRYVGLIDVIAWTSYFIGFILLLFGCMGTCVELFDRRR